MQLSPITAPNGLPMFTAGGPNAYKTFAHRGYVVSLEWVGDGGRRAQPCMVIWAATNVFVRGESNGMWVIGKRAIGEFVGFNGNDKCTGGPSEHAWREAREALPMLGKDRNDQQALTALVDCLIRFAPDLVHMPPTPAAVRKAAERPAMWDIKAVNKSSGKTLSEASV